MKMTASADIKSTLIQISRELLGNHKLDNKSLQYWEQCIVNNLSSFDDFKNNIYSSQVFMNVTKDMYDQLAHEIGDGKLKFAAFYKDHQGPEANAANARKFIMGLPEFAVKSKVAIKGLLLYELEHFDDNMIDFYFNKLVSAEDYSYDKMTADIKSKVHVVVDSGIEQINTSSDIVLSPAVTAPPLYNKEFVVDFEEVFQRPIFIQEYFKYSGMGQCDFVQMYREHNANYNRLREIFESFTGKTISEYYYVHRFLDSVDDVHFFDNIINDIVDSNEYKNSMQRILVEQYKSMYDIDLDEQDIVYIFDIVKRQKLDIKSERIVVILSDLKDENDTIVSNIFKEFTQVLERPPDVYDIEQYTNYYRYRLSEGYASINKSLESILMQTLEFHDIIKKKIKELFVAKNGADIKPSVLFDCLNRVLTRKDDFDMKSMDDIIGSFI